MRHAWAGVISIALVNFAAAQDAPPLPAMPKTGGVAPVAQTQDGTLTPEQKAEIARAVKQTDRKVRVPAGVSAQVGSELPPALELYMLPDATLSDIPAAKLYKYTVLENRVILVDPTNMKVVDILSD